MTSLKGQDIISAWQEGMTEAARSSELIREAAGRESELFPRFAQHYSKLRAMPRRARRAVQRKWKHSLAGIALVLALGVSPAVAADFNVSGGNVADLIQAINDANGNGEADNIILDGSTFMLTAADNTTYGATGLPVITSEITIQGNGSTITRDSTAPNFGIIVVNSSGNFTLQSTTISEGRLDPIPGLETNSGAGIANVGGTVMLTDSIVTGNMSAESGGGVSNSGTMTLINSTVSGNSAVAYRGGGVYNVGGGTMTLTNSTVSGNSASDFRGGVGNITSTMTLSRSLISGNTGGSSPEVQNLGGGTINANDYNLFGSNGSSGTGGFTVGATDIVPASGVMVSDILAPLALNSPGSTQTHALVTDSPAIDASPDDAACEATDQRGVLRPQGAACDVGAFELEATVQPSPTPDVPGSNGGCSIAGSPAYLGTEMANLLIPLVSAFAIGLKVIWRKKKQST